MSARQIFVVIDKFDTIPFSINRVGRLKLFVDKFAENDCTFWFQEDMQKLVTLVNIAEDALMVLTEQFQIKQKDLTLRIVHNKMCASFAEVNIVVNDLLKT